jgi:hypothetical protein
MYILNTLSDIYSNIAGPAVVIMAITTYSDWGRRLLANNHWITVVLIIVMGGLISADIISRHPSLLERSLTTVVNKTISNQVVPLDGYDYENCSFVNVTFEFNGGRFSFVNNSITGVYYKTANPDIEKGWFLLGKLGLLKIPMYDNSGKLIEPGATLY